jgi:hypothetical protein
MSRVPFVEVMSMCVGCEVSSGPFLHSRWFRYYIGGFKNIFFRGHRGEGHPAPWVMFVFNRFGFQVDMRRMRPWLKPEYDRTSHLIWGNFMVAWRRRKASA